MQKSVVLDRSKLLGFRLQPVQSLSGQIVIGAKIGKGPPPPIRARTSV